MTKIKLTMTRNTIIPTKIEYELELENIFGYAANGTGSFIFYGTGIMADKTYVVDESPAQIKELINAAKA